jgi:putative lipoic acid-binding regulatory protein
MECKKKPEINYPCEWSFKVIGADKQLVRNAAEIVMEQREYLLHYSRGSRTGKYHSWNIDLVVKDENERNRIFADLKSHTAITMVI